MIIHTAHLKSKPAHVEAFHKRLLEHAQNSITREGTCHRFDVYQSSENATLFLLFEVYTDEAALESHQASEHVREFRADTADWIDSRTWWFWNEPRTAAAPVAS